MRISLLFPPGWSLITGSPHLALPTLAGSLLANGFDVTVRDCNWEVVNNDYGQRLQSVCTVCKNAAENPDYEAQMEILNKPYFHVEDALNEIAGEFGGAWNLQLGFQYKDFSPRSSIQVLASLEIDSPFRSYYKEKVPLVLSENPGLIVITVACPSQIIPAFQLCKTIREEQSNVKIAMGGNVISRIWREITHTPKLFDLVDFFGIYQGDITVIELAKAIRDGHKYFGIPNLIWRNEGAIWANPIHEIIDLNLLSAPSFDLLPVTYYWGENYLPLNSARGCYHGRCKFCAIPAGWNQKGYGGMRNARLVYEDMFVLSRKYYHLNRFKFVDESMPLATMQSISDFIIQDGEKFQWESFAIMERIFLDPKFMEKISRGGCKKLYFGLETVSQAGRKEMNKRGLIDPLELLKSCANVGIKVHFFTMVGFPGTGRREAEKTIEFILNNKDIIDTVDLSPFIYARDTEVPGVKPIIKKEEDWALDYQYEPISKGILGLEETMALWQEMEDWLWEAKPLLRHPIYRLLSPWR